MKKKIFCFLLPGLLIVNFNALATLSGTKSIPGDFATIKDAVYSLNLLGVGVGGVIFNVAAGHTETSSNMVISIVNNPPNVLNQVIFQKIGAGVNPLITASQGVSASIDGIIKISGSDYVTFDGIDLVDPAYNTGNAMMEWGYALMRASVIDGTQNATIKNCVVTLQKINTVSFGIYISNRDTNGQIVVPADLNGQNSYNRVFGNTISNVYKGIVVISASTTRDINNQIGVVGENPNSVSDFGGGDVASEGISCEGQINVKINNNVVNGGAGTTGEVHGIIATLFGSPGLAQNYEISYNRVTVTTDSSPIYTFGIRAQASGDTVSIHNNIVENCVVSDEASSFFALFHSSESTADTTNACYIYDNIVRNNSHSGNNTTYLIFGGGVDKNLLIRANQVYGNQRTGASGSMLCLYISSSSILMNCESNLVYNNSIPNSSGFSGSTLHGYLSSNKTTIENVFNNKIYNLSVGGSSLTANLVYGIRSSPTAQTAKNIYNNTIYGLSSTGIQVTGISSTSGLSANIFNNKIYDLTASGTSGTSFGVTISSGTSNVIYNNFIAGLKTPNSIQSFGVIGILSNSIVSNSNIGIYNNSIYLNASGGSTFGSAGVSVNSSTTPTSANLDMRNNIIVNLSEPGSTSGVTAAYRRGSTSLANFSNLSNNNIFYAGTPAPNRLIFFDGTNSDQLLSTYQMRVSPRDSNSKSVDVTFNYPMFGDLHLAGSSIDDPDLKAVPVSGITDDIDGEQRDSNYPYKGADESKDFTKYSISGSAKIYQLNYKFGDSLEVENADWGRLEFDYQGSLNIKYANLVVNTPGITTLWQIENYLLFPTDSNEQMSAVLYFDIGDSGVNVDSIEYGLYLSEFPLSSIPHTNTFTNVLNYNSVVYPSLYDPSDTSGVPIYTRAGPIPEYKDIPNSPIRKYENFPNQQCGYNECGPAGISNSLKYMHANSRLPNSSQLKLDNISIEAIKKKLNFFGSGLKPFKRPKNDEINSNTGESKRDKVDEKWIYDKDRHLQDFHHNVKTRKICLRNAQFANQRRNVLENILNNEMTIPNQQDIEMIVMNENAKKQHMVCVTGIAKLKRVDNQNEVYRLWITEDTRQNNDSLEEEYSITYDPASAKILDGHLSAVFGEAHALVGFLIECPTANNINTENINPANGSNKHYEEEIKLEAGVKENRPLVEGLYTYTVQVSETPYFAFDSALVFIDTLQEPEFIIPNNLLQIGKTYYWRMSTDSDSLGPGFYSEPFHFTVIDSAMNHLTLNLNLFIEGRYDGAGIHISDTTTVLLRNNSSPYVIVDSVVAVLSDSGFASLNFLNVPSYDYYLVIKHRNSIETWSSNPAQFSDTSIVNYDFTSAQSQAYGDNMALVSGAWCIFSGDVNQDGTIDATDVSMIDNDAQNFAGGYIVTDLTGDNFVDGTDFAIADNNAGNFVSVIRP